MTPDRVLILHDFAGNRGGAEILTLDLRQGLRERGIDARLMTTTADHRGDLPAGVEPDYLCAGTTGSLRALPEVYNPSARLMLARVLREFKPDIVHLMMFMTALSPSILPLLENVPVVHEGNTYREVCPTGLRWRPGAGLCTLPAGVACREQGCFTASGVVPRRLQLTLLRRWQHIVDRSIAPSHAMAEIMRAHGWPVTDVLHPGIPPLPVTAEMSDTPVIAFAGRLTEEKGVGWLIEAVAHAGDRLGEASVEIIGDGPERAALEGRARELGLDGRVTFHGKLDRNLAQQMLAASWVQIVPSLWPEPFGLVTVEALMRGTPAIVTDQGAQPEIVRDGETGWVVPVGNVEKLAETLAEAVGNRARLQEMGKAAAVDAQMRFNLDAFVDGCMRIYADLLRSRHAASEIGTGHAMIAPQGSS